MIERFHSRWAMDWHRKQQSWRGVLTTKLEMTGHAAKLFLPPLLAIPLFFLRPWRFGRLTPVVIIGTLAFLASLASIWNFPHYMAPFAPLLLIVIVWGLRHGSAVAARILPRRAFAAILVGLQIASYLSMARGYVAAPRVGWEWQRAWIAQELTAMPGRHLVLVRYGERHDPCQEWVYNAADIDGAKIVWARELDATADQALIDYFADRQVWLLEPDSRQLQPIARTSTGSTRLTER
jgi:hypothetical protein